MIDDLLGVIWWFFTTDGGMFGILMFDGRLEATMTVRMVDLSMPAGALVIFFGRDGREPHGTRNRSTTINHALGPSQQREKSARTRSETALRLLPVFTSSNWTSEQWVLYIFNGNDLFVRRRQLLSSEYYLLMVIVVAVRARCTTSRRWPDYWQRTRVGKVEGGGARTAPRVGFFRLRGAMVRLSSFLLRSSADRAEIAMSVKRNRLRVRDVVRVLCREGVPW